MLPSLHDSLAASWVSLRASFDAADVRLFTVGGQPVHLSTVLELLLMVVIVYALAGYLRRFALRRVLTRTHLDEGTQEAIAALVRYAALVIGLMVVAQTFGLNLTTFNVVAGALGVGVAFGLQNIFSNFVSGLIIIFERPIRVGDRIELGPVEGRVTDIGSRRVTLLTNDNITIIVPNQRFITDNVVNLQSGGGRVRLHVPIGVAPGTDPRLVERLMLEAAQLNDDVLAEPAPSVRLVALGGPAIMMELLVWTDRVHARRYVTSCLNFSIGERLQAHDIRTA